MNALLKIRWIRMLLIVLALTILSILASHFFKFSSSHTTGSKTDHFFCNAEELTFNNRFFIGDNETFVNGSTQTDEKALSGKFSSKVDKNSSYGIGMVFKDVQGGDVFIAEVWRYAEEKDAGVLAFSGNWDFWKSTNVVVETNDQGWMLHKLMMYVDEEVEQGELSIFAMNTTETSAFFDDMKIRRTTEEELYDLGERIDQLQILINEKGLVKLKEKRKEALKKGILVTEKGDYTKAFIVWKKDSLQVKLRLKGDWTDHLNGRKWSFRVKVKNNLTWKNFKVFSLQNPSTRSYLDEWVLHKFFEYEDVLTTQYDFVHLVLNGKSLGVYAFEEHFDDGLLDRFERTRGLILKFNEDAFWEAIGRGEATMDKVPYYAGSDIEPFNKKKILNDPHLNQQFKTAQNLMHAYKYGLKKTSELFDIEKLAKYFAVVDVTRGFHAIRWHNQRMYYDPELKKLEVIGFDGYAEDGWFKIDELFVGYQLSGKKENVKPGDNIIYHLFEDEEFVKKYVHYLYKFSDGQYLRKFMNGIGRELNEKEKIIQSEIKDYRYDKNKIINHAKSIYNLIMPYEDASVKAYLEKSMDNEVKLKISNLHCLPVYVRGLGNDTLVYDLAPYKFLPAYDNSMPYDLEMVTIKGNGKRLFYNVAGLDSVYSVKIIPWNAPELN
ncbi:CotH kinase family protein [Candidatus Amoebophilus asiaticus]|nr:CotH kinase family protein [Candidatus Amoebophilus asiaticus]